MARRQIVHHKQNEALDDPTRFKFWLCGRRAGKTTGIVEDLCASIHKAPDRAEIFYVGPTNPQAKELIWEPLEERMDELGWDYDPYISKSRIELSRKRKIYVIGAEKIRRINGHKVFRAYLDEIAYWTHDPLKIWRKHIRPALTDHKGRGIAATTPNGKGTPAYDFHLAAMRSKNWKCFSWHTYDNPFMDRDEIEEARGELDEKTFRQEYEATWEAFEGLAYYNFEETTHLKPCNEIDARSVELDFLLDFNVNPTSLLVGQHVGGVAKIRKEYSLKNSSTPATVKAFCEEYKSLARRVVINIFGDATGQSRRSNTGTSDYYEVQEMLNLYGFGHRMCVPGVNPPIIERVSTLNGWLKNARGEARIEIDPQCVDLIRDLSAQELDGRFPSPKNNLGHKADALGYYCWFKTAQRNQPIQGTIQL